MFAADELIEDFLLESELFKEEDDGMFFAFAFVGPPIRSTIEGRPHGNSLFRFKIALLPYQTASSERFPSLKCGKILTVAGANDFNICFNIHSILLKSNVNVTPLKPC